MFGHEKLEDEQTKVRKVKEINATKKEETATTQDNPYAITKEMYQQGMEIPKLLDARNIQNEAGDQTWLSGNLEEKAKRQLVYFPTKSVLSPKYGERFHNRLNAQQRLEKQSNVKSALYMKKKNEQMLIDARDKYSKSCIESMDAMLEGREVVCEKGQDYKDLAQFMASKEIGFTQDDKARLLDYYLGTGKVGAMKNSGGPDLQKALDLMTKALFAIDIKSLRLDTDAGFVRNAGRLESIMGQVAAYEHMLKKYEEQGSDDDNKTYFDAIGQEAAAIVKEHLDKLRLLSLYYINRRDIMTNSYYVEHYDDEISQNAGEKADQRELSQLLVNNALIGKQLMQSFGASQDQIKKGVTSQTKTKSGITNDMVQKGKQLVNISSNESIELQRQKLEDAFKSMDYFGVNGFGMYSSKAVRSSTSFGGLMFAMDDLKKNSRMFDANSFEMKMVKKHLEDLKGVLGRSAGKVSFYEAKELLLSSLTELVNACDEYKKVKIKQDDKSERHASVVRIQEFADSCQNMVSSMTEKQFTDMKAGNDKLSLLKIFKNSDVIVDQNEEEKERTNKYFLRKQSERTSEEFSNLFAPNTKFSSFRTFRSDINMLMRKKLDVDEKTFNKNKNQLLQMYQGIINGGTAYIKGKKPSMSDDLKRKIVAREIISNAGKMVSLISKLSYDDLRGKNKTELTFETALFGEETVEIRNFTINNGQTTYSVQNAPITTVLTDKPEDIENYKYKKAIEYVGGDSSMLRNYKDAIVRTADGTVKKGIVYDSSIKYVPNSHKDTVDYKYFTAKEIMETAVANNMNIVYSENALKQLTTIRIMDAVFGKTKRNMNSLMYNATTETVYGETSIVIASVQSTSNEGLFGRENIKNIENADDERDTAILDEKGDLTIGAYDRNVADQIMSITAGGCFEEFKKDGLTLTKAEEDAFADRLLKIQNAFLKDKTDANGWRKKQDENDEAKRQMDIQDEKNGLEKYKRWGISDDEYPVINSKEKLKDLQIIKVRDRAGLYNNSLKTMSEQGKDTGYIVQEFLEKKAFFEKNITKEEASKKIKEASAKAKNKAEKDQVQRVFNAQKKIFVIRERMSKYKCNSDKNRMQKKKEYLNIAKPYMDKKEVSKEFDEILKALGEYAQMDVTVVNGMIQTDLSQFMPKYREDSYKEEEGKLGEILNLIEERLNKIPENTEKEVEKLEKNALLGIKNHFAVLMKGKLQVPKGKDIVIEDDRFVDIKIDEVNNVITETKELTMKNRTNEPLFTHEPCANDIAQGGVGDCYLLSTIAAIVDKNPEYIKNMMVDNGNGTVTVRLYGPEGEKYFTVTKSTAEDKNVKHERGGDLYVQGALWVKMLQKAVMASGFIDDYNVKYIEESKAKNRILNAKYHEDKHNICDALKQQNKISYEAYSGGQNYVAAQILLGTKAERVYFDGSFSFSGQLKEGTMKYGDKQKAFLTLVNNLDQKGANYSLTVSTDGAFSSGEKTGLKERPEARGVFNHHVYTVMGSQMIDGKQFIVLRNPWGSAINDFYYNEKTGAVSGMLDESTTSGGYVFMPINTFFKMFVSYAKNDFKS